MERTASRTAEFTGPRQPSWPLRLLGTLLLWNRNLRTRRQLATLDERLLADAGISLSQRQAELDKPFWQ
ncbi:DUF1127 domain-containing protein [Aquipseudomonas campi]